MEFLGVVFYFDRLMFDELKILVVIDIGYGYLVSVCCLSDDNIWNSGIDKIMKFYSFKGEL